MNKTTSNPATPKKCLKLQLKVVLMLVTLISFYYHYHYYLYLIVSCSLLNVGVGVSATAAEPHYNNYRAKYYDDDAGVNKVLQSIYRHSTTPTEKRDHYYYVHHPQHPQSPSSSHQANDIFKKLMYSQGRIDDGFNNDYYYHVDIKDNSVTAHGGGSSSTTGLDAVEEEEDSNLQGKSSSSKLLNKKRYAFSAARIKAEQSDDAGKSQRVENHPQIMRSSSNSGSSSNNDSTTVSCKDELGNSVEWFIAYKLPQISTSSDPLIQQGSKYYYLLPALKSSWQESTYPIHSNNSILATTLDILWKNDSSSSSIARVAYNDQPPSLPAIVMNGHTKGIIWTSTDEGFWLQHSCPHFPDLHAQSFSSSYPPGGLINGQMFFCMSLKNASSVDVIGNVLQYTRPFVYNYSIPSNMEKLIPELVNAAEKNATVKRAPWYNTYLLNSVGDLQLKVHAKGPKFHREIYSTWIAPEYDTGLDVQSWMNGAHPLKSNCTVNKWSVYNVLMKNVSTQNFSYTDDHSKWAVSVDKEKPVVCIGDLNRMKPQKTRGGVTICITDSQIWSAFNSLVREIQPCNLTSFEFKT